MENSCSSPGSVGTVRGGASSSKSAMLDGIMKMNDFVQCDFGHLLSAPSRTDIPNLEIVFIHGLQVPDYKDSYWKTWIPGGKDSDGNERFWPKEWLAEDFPRARIWSLCYDSAAERTARAGSMDESVLGASLALEMILRTDIGQHENCPLVLIGHCLGGLVAKEIVVRAHERLGQDSRCKMFLQNIRGFFFYATPLRGSTLAGWDEPFLSSTGGKMLECLNDSIGRLNSAFEHIWKDLFNSTWHFFCVGESVETRLPLGKASWYSLLGDESSARYVSVAGTDHFDVCKPKVKDSTCYLELLKFIKVMIIPEVLVSKLSTSIREELNKVVINFHQCRRLTDRIDGIAEEVNVQKLILDVKVLESFLILWTRSKELLVECGGTEWMKTTLIRANNKEAYAEVHRELSNFLSMIASKDEASINPTTHLLDEDAKVDMEEMLEKLKNHQKKVEKVSTSNVAGEGDELKSRKDEERIKCTCWDYAYWSMKLLIRKLEKWIAVVYGVSKPSRAPSDPVTIADFGVSKPSRAPSDPITILEHTIVDFPSGALNLEQSGTNHLGKIIEVVSAKSKDQVSNHAQGEQDSSAIYLKIPRSDIVLKRLIGTGSYGDVHEAEWLGCKMCLKDFPWSGGYGEQWLKQAMPLLKLRHPNVLQLVGFSPSEIDSEKPKVLTEIMQGDIRSLIDRRMNEQNGKGTPFSWCMTLDIMIQVARGLACMHKNRFMHGDRVLTTNIIIKVCGDYIDARIGDFGVPEDIPVEHVHIYEPRMGDPQGAETARWMAPEVCAGRARYTTKSDIYSFGILCYELLTSRKPFDHHADVAAVHSQIVAGELRPELPRDLDKRVADVIKMCWHADSSVRPDAQTIVDELEKIQFSKSPTA